MSMIKFEMKTAAELVKLLVEADPSLKDVAFDVHGHDQSPGWIPVERDGTANTVRLHQAWFKIGHLYKLK